MNNFHVYEAIDRGKHSAVYKGRKKKALEYYAIKSVDKSQRTMVHQEVTMLHSLDHPNILKFHSWYETSAHFWLVLEYCVGGNLLNLLSQDFRLPEDSIHDLGRDLVRALQFLHSKGIIYCDLKPSNILLDENGRVKLCDFGLSRRLSDISKSAHSKLLQAKRGTPCYMAPELFQDGGVHSYASDFWAFGCVLYECYAGRPPFVGNEFTKLVKSILSDPTPPLPDNPSRHFINLVNCLLIKDPSERAQWPELCEHSFWRTKITPMPLPPQPAYSNMLQLAAKPYLSERNGDTPVLQRTPPKYRERHCPGAQKQDDNLLSEPKGFATPVKNIQSCRKPHMKNSSKVDDKQKEAVDTAKGVNLLRLSRMVKLNLQRENEKENYRQPLPTASDNDAEVKIGNNDMELDFSENPEDDAPDESDMSDISCTHGEETPIQSQVHGRIGETEHNIDQQNEPFEGNMAVPGESKVFEPDVCIEQNEVAATPPSVVLQRKAQRVKLGFGNAPNSDSAESSKEISHILWHPSDLSVKPVMASRKGDKASDALPVLPFDVLPACDYVKLSSQKVDTLNSQITYSLRGSSPVSEKQNVIKYIEMLSGNTDAANILTNGPVMSSLIKMLRSAKTSVLHAQYASVIGLLIRHSTFIVTDLASSRIVEALEDGLRDKRYEVRRSSMVALGELLFYISTQNDQKKDKNVIKSPSKDNQSASGWQVPSSVIALVSSLLRKGGENDDVTLLYALRTVENICSQGGELASRFSSKDVIGNLCYIYNKSSGKQENARLTAGSCLVRLVRFNPPSILMVFEKFSFKDVASAVIKGSPREQQISLNILSMAMLGSHMLTNIRCHLLSLVEEKILVPALVSLIEKGSECLRGKTLVFVALLVLLLCKNSPRWLPHFLCNSKLLSAVDRLAREKDGFVLKCMEAFVEVVVTTVPTIFEITRGDIQQIMGGRRHGQNAALTVRGNPKGTAAHLFPVILHLLGSSCLKHAVVTSHVLLQLANLIKLIESPFQGRDDFQITLLRVLESITEEPTIIFDDPKIFTSQVLPSLAILCKGNRDEHARFLCLKVLFDVMVVLFNDTHDKLSTDGEITKGLETISGTYFLPLYSTLIEDEAPIAMYAQKLLVIFIEFNYVKVSDILNIKIVSQCFRYLLGDHLSNTNVNGVKLCLALASAPELETKILSQLRVVRKLGNLLEFVNAEEMEDFLEPTLRLYRAFILRAVGSNRANAYSKEPALLLGGDPDLDLSIAVDQQHSIKDITDFGSITGVFLELIGNHEAQIADLASECLVLLLKAAPREATMGLLTNLPRISIVLESWNHGVSGLLSLRLVYSLAFSCRQFLSQAMILSISVPDVIRIEGIISSLKSSSVRGVAKAAQNLALELQRLPRCV